MWQPRFAIVFLARLCRAVPRVSHADFLHSTGWHPQTCLGVLTFKIQPLQSVKSKVEKLLLKQRMGCDISHHFAYSNAHLYFEIRHSLLDIRYSFSSPACPQELVPSIVEGSPTPIVFIPPLVPRIGLAWGSKGFVGITLMSTRERPHLSSAALFGNFNRWENASVLCSRYYWFGWSRWSLRAGNYYGWFGTYLWLETRLLWGCL